MNAALFRKLGATGIYVALALALVGPRLSAQIFEVRAEQNIWWPDDQGGVAERTSLFAVSTIGQTQEQSLVSPFGDARSDVSARVLPGVVYFSGSGLATGQGEEASTSMLRVSQTRMFIGASDVFVVTPGTDADLGPVTLTLRMQAAGSIALHTQGVTARASVLLQPLLQAVREDGAQWADSRDYRAAIQGYDRAGPTRFDEVLEVQVPYEWGTRVNLNLGAWGQLRGETTDRDSAAYGEFEMRQGLRFSGLSIAAADGSPVHGYTLLSEQGFNYAVVPEPSGVGAAGLLLLTLVAARGRRMRKPPGDVPGPC